ncbi:hypothetical protein COCC4DRAFT_185674 [Bipolaris maydis ATCC 48331]|uniref:Uncharacterized protein n=2 Tax=Cochliobolus heterostrophus TaxID=5016 RepID=M2TTC9_COCH5|nr:uncharacterized protein COCC4DRAFT_185674 [Bipolaris maydis ATCC 48331]EMD89769.1 hypothetical protein COCHEDRAFT_1225383 [Bipolaris maydis C5]ENI10019.1 hypothetical protein COCC4DRAFT_185674 [Bipolaris maydis ATCC 48331]KAJ6207609.1 hypothetical protein PSV09DRAFT_1225383 [Bipolaris maydis]
MVFGSKIIVEANLFNSEHIDGAGSFDYIQCEPGAKPQILKHNVRDLVRKLQVDDPYTFGLLKCKGFVAETVPAGYAELLSLTLVFREPPGPRSLREILLNTPTSTSTTRRLEITRDLARHPPRQGFSPHDDYEMHHYIYSLGVCLLEIGLWGSFVEYDPTTGAHSLSQLLTARSEKDKDLFVALAQCPLPGSMGDTYAEIVETCLTCLDPGNVDSGDEKAFEDEDGILVGVRYIEKVLLRLGKPIM